MLGSEASVMNGAIDFLRAEFINAILYYRFEENIQSTPR